MKHTPANWDRSIWGPIVVWPKYHDGCYIQKGNDELIAFVTANDRETGVANARLIECAPEMLDALLAADNLLAELGHSLPQVKAVIKKASSRET